METVSVKHSIHEGGLPSGDPIASDQIQSTVEEVLASTVIDIHTHLFSPAFGNLGLWGIDELLTYHYLEAEFFRSSEMLPEHYWRLSKPEQADAIWRTLFLENIPCRKRREELSPFSTPSIYPPTVTT